MPPISLRFSIKNVSRCLISDIIYIFSLGIYAIIIFFSNGRYISFRNEMIYELRRLISTFRAELIVTNKHLNIRNLISRNVTAKKKTIK